MIGYASLSLRGDRLEFNAISRLLDIKPDAMTKKGQLLPLGRVAQSDSWRYASQFVRRNHAPQKPLDRLIRRLYRNSNAIAQLKEADFGVQNINISVLIEAVGKQAKFHVPSRHIKFAALLGASLWFDVWRTEYSLPTAHSTTDWSNLQKGQRLQIFAQSDFENCDVHITAEEVRLIAQLDIELEILVW